jgi:hypothetical protein
MGRERVLKFVLVVVSFIFCALVYPLTLFWKQEPALAMMLSLYVTLGVSCCWQCVTLLQIAASSPLQHGRDLRTH